MGGVLSYVWPEGRLFWLFCGFAGFLTLLLLAVSISSALYLVAEACEEYPTLTGVILKRYALPIVLCLHVMLYIDGLPFYSICVGIICHGVYYLTLRSFPFVKVMSFNSLLCVCAFVWSHWVWFSYFNEIGESQKYGSYANFRIDALHMIGFFCILVWLLPVGIFVSMSVSDNVLPGIIGDSVNSLGGNIKDERSKGKSNLFRLVYDKCSYLTEWIVDKLFSGSKYSIQKQYSVNQGESIAGNYAFNGSPNFAPEQFMSSRNSIYGKEQHGPSSAHIPSSSSAPPPSLNQRKKE